MGQSHGGSGRLRGPGGNGGDFWSGGHPEVTQEMYCWGWFPLKIRTLLHEDPPQRGGDTVGPSGHRGTPPPVTRGHPPISGPPLHARSSIVWSPPPPPPPPRMHPLPWRSLMGNLSPWLGTRRPSACVSPPPTFRPSPPLPYEQPLNPPPPPPSLPPGCEFGQADMQKLVPKEEKAAPSPPQGGKRAGGQRDPRPKSELRASGGGGLRGGGRGLKGGGIKGGGV